MPFEGSLPVMPPLAPMLAKGVDRIPEGDDWLYEPKWDGFRAVVFRDGDHLAIRSRDTKPLLRYFPELTEPLLTALPERCVVDGELVIPGTDGSLDFGRLQMRLHPAASRIAKLSVEIPAQIVLWDLLCLGDDDLMGVPFRDRRSALERVVIPGAAVHITPISDDPSVAKDWFERFEGAGLDGVIAKPASGAYEPKKRAMRKIKHLRSVDCVLVGFRWHKSGEGVGSLILGLFDETGALRQLGVASSFSKKRRLELVEELEPLRADALEDHPWKPNPETESQQAGMKSRWNAGRDLSWEPVRLERVVEVACNQLSAGRFRHPAKFVRWREDREPATCTYDQLDVAPPMELSTLLT